MLQDFQKLVHKKTLVPNVKKDHYEILNSWVISLLMRSFHVVNNHNGRLRRLCMRRWLPFLPSSFLVLRIMLRYKCRTGLLLLPYIRVTLKMSIRG